MTGIHQLNPADIDAWRRDTFHECAACTTQGHDDQTEHRIALAMNGYGIYVVTLDGNERYTGPSQPHAVAHYQDLQRQVLAAAGALS